MLKKLKKNLCKIKKFNEIITNRSINLHKIRVNQIEKGFSKKLKFFSPINFKYLHNTNYDSFYILG